jgi:hypothetical protein
MEPDLNDLLAAWLGRDVDPARREELLARLRRDETFRRAFVAEVWMLGKLKAVQSPESRWLRLEDELGWSAAEATAGEALEDRVVSRLPLPKLARPRAWRGWAGAAAALVLLGAGLALWSWPRRGERPRAATRAYPKVDPQAGLAIVVKLDGVQWNMGDDPPPGEGDVLAPGRLRFRSGRIVLSTLTGVMVAAGGPADLELVSNEQVVCRQGRLRVRSPAGQRGFVVSGPNSAVLDLGTEFGVNTDPDGTARARVFDGQVESALTGADGAPQRTRLFRVNEAFAIDPRAGQIESVAEPVDFLGPLNLTAPPLVLGADYPAAVGRSRPWGYWRFESSDGETIANEIAGRPALRVVGPIRLAGGPGGNRYAEFPAGPERKNLELDALWHPTWRSGFAVELWVLSEQVGHASLVSMTAPHDTNNHLILLELTSRNLLHKPASVRFLHRWPPGGTDGDNLYSLAPYVPYRWHHVVGQFRGDRIELYLDGAAMPPLSVNPAHPDEPCRILVGRLTTRPGHGISIDRPLVGRMDELALYDHPLTAEEIRDHSRLGAGAPRR